MYEYEFEVSHKETGEVRTKKSTTESNVVHDVIPAIMNDMGIDKEEMNEWNVVKFEFNN